MNLEMCKPGGLVAGVACVSRLPEKAFNLAIFVIGGRCIGSRKIA